MATSKVRNGVHYLNMGGAPMWFGVALSDRAYRKEMKAMGVTDHAPFMLNRSANATAHSFENKHGGLCVLICFDVEAAANQSIDKVVGLIAHECLHALDALVERIGEKSAAQEFRAYQIQWMTGFCYTALTDAIAEFRKEKQCSAT